jgi:hypothetical protein
MGALSVFCALVSLGFAIVSLWAAYRFCFAKDDKQTFYMAAFAASSVLCNGWLDLAKWTVL